MGYRKYNQEEAREKAAEKRRELEATMQQGVQALLAELRQGKSERLMACLTFAARFHRYSARNQWLIMLECRRRGIEPGYVAGFTTWKRLNYTVKEGEKGIPIYAPRPFKTKDKKTDEDVDRVAFRVEHVFTETQVKPLKEGLPSIPQFYVPLAGNVDELGTCLLAVIQQDGIEVVERDLSSSGALGISEKGRISLTLGLASINKFLVLVHEYAHELLHPKEISASLAKSLKECQAEAVAYIVAYHFGIESPFSSDYLQVWGNDEKSLLAEIETVQQIASIIIKKMERLDGGGDNPSTEDDPALPEDSPSTLPALLLTMQETAW